MSDGFSFFLLQMDGALVPLHGPGSREQQREDAHGG
jgi:hypothetical protein